MIKMRADNATKTYKRIVTPMFRQAKQLPRVPYFEWRMNCFAKGVLDPLLESQQLDELVLEFSKRYPTTSGFSFYGAYHGRRLVSLNGTKEGITISYLKNWNFRWIESGDNEMFYKEAASPADCADLSIASRDFYLTDSASIQTAILLGRSEIEELSTKIAFDFAKLDRETTIDLAQKLFITGVIASYNNDKCYLGMIGENLTSGSTGRKTNRIKDPKSRWWYEREDNSRKMVCVN
jgi:hypothetical protein